MLFDLFRKVIEAIFLSSWDDSCDGSLFFTLNQSRMARNFCFKCLLMEFYELGYFFSSIACV